MAPLKLPPGVVTREQVVDAFKDSFDNPKDIPAQVTDDILQAFLEKQEGGYELLSDAGSKPSQNQRKSDLHLPPPESNVEGNQPNKSSIPPLELDVAETPFVEPSGNGLTAAENDLVKRLSDVDKINEIAEETGNADVALDRFLSMALRAHDLSFGLGTRNTCRVDYYDLVCAVDLKERVLPELLSDVMMNRDYVALTNESPEGLDWLLVKKVGLDDEKGPRLEVLDRETNRFVELTQERYDAFPIDDNTRLTLGNTLSSDAVTHHHSEATLSVDADRFYHEVQNEGLCAIHAANAMLGDRFVTPSGLTEFNTVKLTNFGVIPPDDTHGRYDDLVVDPSSSEGNDPSLLKEYLESMTADEGTAFPFAKVNYEQVPKNQIEEKVGGFAGDRCVIGSGVHFVAFRKNANDEWVKIDSLDSEQEKLSPMDYIAKRHPNEAIHFIQIEFNAQGSGTPNE